MQFIKLLVVVMHKIKLTIFILLLLAVHTVHADEVYCPIQTEKYSYGEIDCGDNGDCHAHLLFPKIPDMQLYQIRFIIGDEQDHVGGQINYKEEGDSYSVRLFFQQNHPLIRLEANYHHRENCFGLIDLELIDTIIEDATKRNHH